LVYLSSKDAEEEDKGKTSWRLIGGDIYDGYTDTQVQIDVEQWYTEWRRTDDRGQQFKRWQLSFEPHGVLYCQACRSAF